jgi:hypothetical protein
MAVDISIEPRDYTKAPHNADTVALLERVLVAAKLGEIVGVAAAFVHRDSGPSSRAVGMVSRAQLGVLEILKSQLIEQLKD